MRTLLWFRKALRLHDNHALAAAIEGGGDVFPVFVLDPHFLRSGRVGAARMTFLFDTLADLHANLQKRSSSLFCVQGSPESLLPQLFKQWNITRLAYEYDNEPYAKARDQRVTEIAALHGVDVVVRYGHTLFAPNELLEACGGKMPGSYGSLVKAAERLSVPAELATPSHISTPAKLWLAGSHAVPTMESLGLTRQATPFAGGESEGLSRMQRFVARESWIAAFEKPKTNPAKFVADDVATTVLGPYLKFGCVSVRKMFRELQRVLADHPKHTAPPVSLVGQLYWREYFYLAGHTTPNFDKMAGNPICRQIPWGSDAQVVKAWEDARTGFPWIDAIMTQLRQWGWIHHLARHSVACFLTRGNLWQSWEAGAEVFDRLLLDADWAINHGNWMWLSASAFFHQYYRVYSPVSFGKQYDPNGDYIRHFVPALRHMPAKYIYSPWEAPLAVQEKAGCIIGQDYPLPIVDHDVARDRNMQMMKAAYGGGGGQKEEAKEEEDEEGAKRPQSAAAAAKRAKSK